MELFNHLPHITAVARMVQLCLVFRVSGVEFTRRRTGLAFIQVVVTKAAKAAFQPVKHKVERPAQNLRRNPRTVQTGMHKRRAAQTMLSTLTCSSLQQSAQREEAFQSLRRR